jgi:hypothetical protein
MDQQEKRKHARYKIDATSEIVMDQTSVKGPIKDISFSGYFVAKVNCSSEYCNTEVDIKITTTDGNVTYNIEGRGRIIRHGDAGIGLNFVEMDDENINMLNKIILDLSLKQPKK